VSGTGDQAGVDGQAGVRGALTTGRVSGRRPPAGYQMDINPSHQCWTGAVFPPTLPDTCAVTVRDAVKVPDTADGAPRPVSAL
jgi:hypothetical protein